MNLPTATVLRFCPDHRETVAIRTLARSLDAAVLAHTGPDTPPHQVALAILWALQNAVRRGFPPENWPDVACLLADSVNRHFAEPRDAARAR